MKQIRIICVIIFLAGFCSCRRNALSIPGTNAISATQIFSTSATVNAYLATLYADLPIEDFSFCNGDFGQFPANGNEYTANWDDEAFTINSYDNAMSGASGTDVFTNIYKAIRIINTFIQQEPSAQSFTQAQLNYWLGEAKFCRAYCYFGLVKYYGGVPLILTPQATATPVPRATEVAVYNQIKADLESAETLMSGATLATTLTPNGNYGHATKWAAFALEARAMLHGGSIGMFDNTGNLAATGGINGVDAASATTYMQAAYNACDSIMASGIFTLYNKYPSNLQQNFQYLFYDATQGTSNSEGIFYKGYDYATSNQRTHSEDLLVMPHAIQSSAGYGNDLQPNLDLEEKFQNMDGSQGALGAELGYNTTNNVNIPFHYASEPAAFANKDPRLGATFVLPGTAFRNSTTAPNLQGGWITGQKGVILGGTKYNASNYGQWFNLTSHAFTTATSATPPAGSVWGSGNSAYGDTPFWLKKWTDPVIDISLIVSYTSRTSWIDMRYGEVLLDFAEASFLLGKPAAEQLSAINLVRARAGMPAYTTITQDEIRNERFVEFAFENKNFWDYIRWRTLTTVFNNHQEYGVDVYWDADTNDYALIKVPDGGPRTYQVRDYYSDIPGSDISSNSAIAKQVHGGHNPGY